MIEVLPCSCVLFLAGILCSAAGIGGGGIYVVVLMVCGRLSPHNAVPLSKAAVFFGSVSSLVVNMKHAIRPESDRKRNCVIDPDACRVVVPSTLIGTYFGVMLNNHISDKLLMIMLSVILCAMVVMVGRMAMKQRTEELGLTAGKLSTDNGPTVALLGHESGNKDLVQKGQPAGRESLTVHQPGSVLLPSGLPPLPMEQVGWFQIRNKFKVAPGLGGLEDVVKAGVLLLIVVTGGIVSFHMYRCRAEQSGDISQRSACAHPINKLFGKKLLGSVSRMSAWMSESSFSLLLPWFVLSLSLLQSVIFCGDLVIVGLTAMKQRTKELGLTAGKLSTDSRPTVAVPGLENGNKDVIQKSEPAGRESLRAYQRGPVLLPSGPPPLPMKQLGWLQICNKPKVAPGLGDAVKAGVLLLIVVTGGIFSFHMQRCRVERRGNISQRGACAHPINKLFGMTFLGGASRTSVWMSDSSFSVLLPLFVVSVPICTCVAFSICSGLRAIRLGWAPPRTVAVYQAVSVMTGMLAGLVGVGGGLILSPFFLITGMEPSVAVGTSATCVLFTSASTSLQYIFADRIIMSLALVYGVATTMASWLGTSLVHIVRERLGGGKSYITMIVALSVALSAGLSLWKFVSIAKEGQASAPVSTGTYVVAPAAAG